MNKLILLLLLLISSNISFSQKINLNLPPVYLEINKYHLIYTPTNMNLPFYMYRMNINKSYYRKIKNNNIKKI